MKIVSAEAIPFSRSFATPMVTAFGRLTEREGVILKITTATGAVGYGEAAALPGFSFATPEQTKTDIEYVATSLPGIACDAELATMTGLTRKLCAGNAGCRFALEAALCDAAAREKDLPLGIWLSADAHTRIPVNFLIGRETEINDEMIRFISEREYRAVKIKVGGDVTVDVERIRRLYDGLGPDVLIRLDANRAWDERQARTVLTALADVNIDYVEEPLSYNHPDALQALRAETNVPVALDESILTAFESVYVIKEDICDVVIIKPATIGCIAEIIDTVDQVTALGGRAVLTSMLETEVGMALLLHLAAALPGDIPPCGFDTLRLFSTFDPVMGEVSGGCLAVPPGGGIGYE